MPNPTHPPRPEPETAAWRELLRAINTALEPNPLHTLDTHAALARATIRRILADSAEDGGTDETDLLFASSILRDQLADADAPDPTG